MAADGAEQNRLWRVPADCAFPSATQNEINARDAKSLLANGITAVVEGANMPTTPEGVDLFLAAGILYGPGKAANAGGVAVSGLEMAQDIERRHWPRQDVDEQLRSIMKSMHEQVSTAAEEYGCAGNYVAGANIAGFLPGRGRDAGRGRGVGDDAGEEVNRCRHWGSKTTSSTAGSTTAPWRGSAKHGSCCRHSHSSPSLPAFPARFAARWPG